MEWVFLFVERWLDTRTTPHSDYADHYHAIPWSVQHSLFQFHRNVAKQPPLASQREYGNRPANLPAYESVQVTKQAPALSMKRALVPSPHHLRRLTPK